MSYLKVKEIPEILGKKYDFTHLFCTFLDDFYLLKNKDEKSVLIFEEPERGRLKKRDFCMLACAVHKLACDSGLEVPAWVYDSKFFMKSPVYAHNTKRQDYRAFLRETTPEEYKMRNIFYGDSILQRV